MTRRKMLKVLAATATSMSTLPWLLSAVPSKKRLGIGMHSYGFHWQAGRDRNPNAKFSGALEFLEYCHKLGAGGVQVSISSKEQGDAKKIRAKAESCNMYFEGQLGLPKSESDIARFETELHVAKEAGASVVRAVLLGGRRYETFRSAEAFKQFRDNSWKSLTLAEPVLKRHGLRLAIENHKDLLASELVEVLRRLSSEFIGVCLDFGNSIALLEEPMEVVQALAPFAFSTHIKDMAVAQYEDGFLLSEVPLGEGILDLAKIISILQKANPAIEFNLEMITRDPLKVPCFTNGYWVTMENMQASRLAQTLAFVKKNAAAKPLPHTTGLPLQEQLKFEDSNVRQSLAFAKHSLGL